MTSANVLDGLVVADALRDRQTAAGFVADSLREAIRSGRFADGAELNAVAIAGHFGISRVPVREALRALEAEGWISALPHRRAVVLAQSPERVQEIFEMRAVLEAHLLAKTIAHIAAPDIADLDALCTAMEALTDHQAWVAANRAFHRRLLEAANAPLTLEMVEQLTAQVERYLRRHGAGVNRETEAGSEHRAIVDAVAQRDTERATALIAAHIDQTRGRVIAAIAHDRATKT